MDKRILIIDDDEAVRNAFLLALEDTPYKAETVDRGRKGVEKVKRGGIDLVFLDLKMPEMNGVETLRAIRKIDSDLPVYIVTAFHKEFIDELKEAEKAELEFQLLQKPLSSDQIVIVAKSILEGPVGF